MSKAKIAAAKGAVTKAKNAAEAAPDDATLAQTVADAEAVLATLEAPPPAGAVKTTDAGANEMSTVAKSQDAQNLENMQIMVGDLVKELGLQEGYQLATTLAELQDQLRDLHALKAKNAAAEKAAAEKPKTGEYVTLMSCTSRRGVLPEGEVVTAADFGGKEALAENEKRGLVHKVTK